MYDIAERFNSSSTVRYFISCKRHRLIPETYKSQVKLITKLATSIYASTEGHTYYIFRRVGNPGIGPPEQCFGVPCDPLFMDAWKTCKCGFDAVNNHVAAKVDQFFRKSLEATTSSPTGYAGIRGAR